jgi:hypothetical protein
MLRGVKKLGFKFTLTMASYNLIRLPRLIEVMTPRSNPRHFEKPSMIHHGHCRAGFKAPIQFRKSQISAACYFLTQ